MLAPLATALATLAFVAMVAATRVVSAGSLVAAILILPSVALVAGAPRAVTLGALVTAALIAWRHRANIERIWHGTERRLTRAREDGGA